MKIRENKPIKTAACIGACAGLMAGCQLFAPPPATLSMTSKPIIDKSVLAPKMGGKAYSKIMVISPSGTVRGEYSSLLAMFEREFLKQGVTVVTPAITGKVNEQAIELSDLERALVLADGTGAEAILQIGAFEWGEGAKPTRFFVVQRDPKYPVFNEVAEDVFMANRMEDRFEYSANKLTFTGRLIDISGEVVATLNMAQPVNHVLPREYQAKFALGKTGWEVFEQNYPYFSEYWISKAQALAEEQVVGAVVKLVLSRK